MSARSYVRVLGLVGPLSLVACSAILGFEPLSFDPSVGTDGGANDGATNADGATSGDAANADGGGGGDAATDAGGDGAACTADLTSDKQNCGACGHDCLGGDCDGGVCQPGKLADALGIPKGLVVDDTNVFVAEKDVNRIIRLDKNKVPGTCNSISALTQCVFADSPGAFQPEAMAIDGTNVYWSNNPSGSESELRACPRAGCGGSGARLVRTLSSDALVTDIQVAGGYLVWAENNGSAIRRVLPDGGAQLTLLASSSYSPFHLAVDDTTVFFTEDGNNQPGPTSIRAVNLDGGGGAPRPIMAASSKTHGIALTASGDLFWTVPIIGGPGDGVVEQGPKTGDGGAPVGAFAGNQVEPAAIIVDQNNVYWVQSGSDAAATGMVVYCPLAGCPSGGPIVLADHQAYPRYITQDDKAIYWSNEGLTTSTSYDGQVWKLAKPLPP